MQGRSVLSGTQQKEAITRMIEVKHLTKQYGDKLAVNDISFTVEDGEILGLLGPNVMWCRSLPRRKTIPKRQ